MNDLRYAFRQLLKNPGYPLLLATVSLLLLFVGLLASFVPARRAAKTDPMEALRCE